MNCNTMSNKDFLVLDIINYMHSDKELIDHLIKKGLDLFRPCQFLNGQCIAEYINNFDLIEKAIEDNTNDDYSQMFQKIHESDPDKDFLLSPIQRFIKKLKLVPYESTSTFESQKFKHRGGKIITDRFLLEMQMVHFDFNLTSNARLIASQFKGDGSKMSDAF